MRAGPLALIALSLALAACHRGGGAGSSASVVVAPARVVSAQPAAAAPLPPPVQAMPASDPADGPVSEAPPTTVGTCSFASVKDVGTRLQGDPSSGSAISYVNGVAQVSYDDIPAIDDARPGDVVRLCLVSLPKDCPPGDDRGKVYRAVDQRTGQSWTAPDSEHSCGGA
jgi:hypothetical protein